LPLRAKSLSVIWQQTGYAEDVPMKVKHRRP
jgi:hypothetical protein